MRIFNIQHFSTGDGPGIRSTVFFAGCNLHCPWCHNPEGLYTPGNEMTLEEVVRDVMSDIEFYEQSGGGVTLSGGEPLCSLDDCTACAEAFRENHLHVIVDTALSVPDVRLNRLARYTDCFFADLKTTDPEKFASVCGGDLNRLYGNLDTLQSLNADFVLRVPLIPGFNMDPASLDGIISVIRRYNKPFTLLPFHRMGSAKYRQLGRVYEYADTMPSDREVIRDIQNRFIQSGLVPANV